MCTELLPPKFQDYIMPEGYYWPAYI